MRACHGSTYGRPAVPFRALRRYIPAGGIVPVPQTNTDDQTISFLLHRMGRTGGEDQGNTTEREAAARSLLFNFHHEFPVPPAGQARVLLRPPSSVRAGREADR